MSNIIAVLMGGNSSEREISLASGNAILESLQRNNIPCIAFDWNGNNLGDLWREKFDKVFIALHGKGGEDGYIQHILEEKNIQYTGTNSKNSHICMDKNLTKQVCKNNNLPTAFWQKLHKNDSVNLNDVTFPLAIKPTLEGSSIGISKVEKAEHLQNALDMAFTYGNEIIAEEWIVGRELTVAIVKNQVLPVVEIITSSEFYDYEAKYQSNDTSYICPADLNEQHTLKIQQLALQVFNVLGMKDWGRVDFIKDSDDNFYILEVNTVPGMTSHSLVPMSAFANNISFDELVQTIIA